jgi:hypothetical protein
MRFSAFASFSIAAYLALASFSEPRVARVQIPAPQPKNKGGLIDPFSFLASLPRTFTFASSNISFQRRRRSEFSPILSKSTQLLDYRPRYEGAKIHECQFSIEPSAGVARND